MSDKTGIEWTDATWNPVTGCTEVSPGCDHCYAKTFAERWRGVPGHYFGKGFDVQLRPDKLTLPLRWKKPRRVFVNSMSDLFHQDVPTEYIAKVFAVMAMAGQHTFQLLTKRHARMRSLLSDPFWDFQGMVGAARYDLGDTDTNVPTPELRSWGWPLPNVWLGVSVENQQWADIRIPALIDTPAAVRFLSCEPLLGPVDLAAWLRWINWVIAGGESGHGARPMHPEWAQRLRNQCVAASVPFLFKQWGEFDPVAPLKDGVFDWGHGVTVANDGTVYQRDDLVYPNGPRRGEAIRAGHDRASLTGMYRVGKKAAGRELDGRTWDEYPEVSA